MAEGVFEQIFFVKFILLDIPKFHWTDEVKSEF